MSQKSSLMQTYHSVPGTLTADTLLAAATVGAMSAADTAQAQATGASPNNIGDVANTLTDQFGNLGTAITGGSFIVGLVFIGAGMMKLKAAVDSQGQQTKYGEGLWRLGLGAGLAAVPAVMGVGLGTFGLDNDTTMNITNGIGER
jgi:hypothetical protein